MVFAEVLHDVSTKVEGVVGLVVMGYDGIPIERQVKDGFQNFELLTTESTTLLRSTKQSTSDVGVGSLRELIYMTDRYVVLAVTITDEYVLLGVVEQGSNYGKARFHLKQAALRLEKEFL
jgi:predicted regulator of Ras-like GTPase activity (Roadblock/LC7/MglB family)